MKKMRYMLEMVLQKMVLNYTYSNDLTCYRSEKQHENFDSQESLSGTFAIGVSYICMYMVFSVSLLSRFKSFFLPVSTSVVIL